MAHQRQTIRENVAAALSAHVSSVQGRVFRMRFLTYNRLSLPAASVYTTEETADTESGYEDRADIRRTLTLAVEGVLQYGDSVEDELDSLADEIEAAMALDRTFGGAADDSEYAGSAITIAVDGDTPVGIVTLTYNVYYTNPSSNGG